MPARVNKIRHDENTRLKIQAAKIIARLNDLVHGVIPPEAMPAHVVNAALGLLRKTLPDLNSVEHSGDVTISKVIRAPTVAQTAQSWSADHVPPHMTEH